jgi:hypothetical protein
LRTTCFAWKEQAMNDPANGPDNRHPSKAQAGGFFLFAGLAAGSIIGVMSDQPSMGMVGGFAAGAAAALIIWLIDRRRG